MKSLKSIAFSGLLLLACCVAYGQAAEKERSLSDLYNAVKSETDISRMEALVQEMENKNNEGTGNGELIDVSRRILATSFAENKKATKAAYWANRITNDVAKDYTIHAVIDQLVEAGAYEEAEKILKPVWEKYKKNTAPAVTERSMYPRLTATDFETLYGMILFKKGAYKKALPLLAPVADAPNKRGDNHRRAEYYAMALSQSGETEKALEAMNKLLLAPGHRSSAFKDETKRLHKQKYGNMIKYDQLMDSLALVEKQKMESKVAKMAVNEPAPDFTLTDLNGKKVSLQSLRGKTVILDFWATWCQPCVASFPGMQRAVDHYKDDTSVVFMFIHTAEHSTDPVGDVKRFMANKKYRFDVYMDLKDKTTGKNTVQEAYKIRGIPAKFIIDKDGMIRYKNAGYVSEDEAVPEISTMVENIRKTNKEPKIATSSRDQLFRELTAMRDTALRNEKIWALVNSGQEEHLLTAYSFCYFNKDLAKAADILQKGVKRFPKGELAYAGLNMKMHDEKNTEKKEELLEEIMREYSDKPVSPLVLFELVTTSSRTANKEKLWRYLEMLKQAAGNQAYIVALTSAATADPLQSEPLLKPLVDSLELRYAALVADKDTSARKQKELRATASLFNSGLSAYSETLIANGKEEQAYQLISKKYTTDARDPFQFAYLKTLLATKRYKEAYPLIEAAIRTNAASADVKAKYREAYKAVHGSDTGFREHEKQLLLSIKDKIRQDAIKHAVNQPAPLFTLKDVNGSNVSLADLKGKVVVMDFWATWCGPCKASFPSMQMAVNKYKDDPNVKFVFIHTWEKGEGDPVKNAKSYVVDNKYSFHVLMDLRDPATKLSEVAGLYKVSGIPTKIVIDPNGNIRFNVAGFNGIPEVAVEELSAMIEYAKGKNFH
jgi:peroxiredoxin